MKQDIYKKATDKIWDLSWEAVYRQIPALDYIMGVANMSETDKVFYEAYKKYGNRNHTWQDFKAMFGGDVNVMQKTVKHWKTWDEFNNILNRLFEKTDHIKELLDKYNLKGIKTDFMQTHPEYKDLYPDLVAVYQDFLNDLNSNGLFVNYSTFDPEIAKLEREFERNKKHINPENKEKYVEFIQEYIDKMYNLIDLRNGDFVVAERMEIYGDIIRKDPRILKMAVNFNSLSESEKIDFARMILNASAKRFGVPQGKVVHVDEHNNILLHPQATGGYNPVSEQFLLKVNNDCSLKDFLEMLAHEDGHRIDNKRPDMGMIGLQTMKWNVDNYVNNNVVGDEYYRKWPTELSSYYIGSPVSLIANGDDMRRDIHDNNKQKKQSDIKSVWASVKNLFSRR